MMKLNEYADMVYNKNRKFKTEDLIKFVVERWDEGYFISFGDALDFMCDFCSHQDIDISRKKIHAAWQKHNNITTNTHR